VRISSFVKAAVLASAFAGLPAYAAVVSVDLSHKIAPYKPTYAWFGYDEGNYTTMRDGKVLLRKLSDLSPVPVHVRVHHLLTSGDGVAELKWSSTNVYREDAAGKPVYDFTILDGIFDEFKAAGVTPMVELGFMPKDMASGTNDYKVSYPARTTSGSVQSPPKDFAKWQELVRVFTAHLVDRYGAATVKKWYFEVWNEPDIDYWHGTPQQYWQLYDHSVAGVRAALPGALVGGPASTGPNNAKAYKFLDDFLGHVSAAKVPLDFISFHVKGQPKIEGSEVRMGIAKELNDADKGFEIVARHGYGKLPIILSEADPEGCAACSMKVNPANGYRNGTLYSSYTAAAYKGLLDLAIKHKVNLISMLSWSFEFENKDYFEGFRDLSTNGIDKPILNFFRMAALLKGDRVSVSSDGAVSLTDKMASGVGGQADIDGLATMASHEAALLLWNYQDEEKSASAEQTQVKVAGLPKGIKRVLATQYRIDDNHSNAYTAWKAMGSPQSPSTEQIAELKSKAGLQLLYSPYWVTPSDGVITIQSDLPRHAVSLIHLSW
jgi:xylan 1,4-beta-xylosidase